MDNKFTVTLQAVADIDGKRYPAEADVRVTPGVALQLVEMGVIARLPDIDFRVATDPMPLELTTAATAMAETMVGAAVAEAMANATAELEQVRQLADERALKISALEAEIAAIKAPARTGKAK